MDRNYFMINIDCKFLVFTISSLNQSNTNLESSCLDLLHYNSSPAIYTTEIISKNEGNKYELAKSFFRDDSFIFPQINIMKCAQYYLKTKRIFS